MKRLRAFVRYLLVCGAWTLENPRYFMPFSWLSEFSSWRVERDSTATTLERKAPWLCNTAIRELDQIVSKDKRVFEYGSGGSTLYFAAHCGEVVAVDHSQEWAQMVNDALAADQITHAKVLPIPGEPAASPQDADAQQGYGSAEPQFEGISYKNYVLALSRYPKGHFNIIVIDGRSRSACVKQASEYIAPGGVIIVDNVERKHYQPAQQQYLSKHFRLKKFAGPVHGLNGFNATNFWTHQPEA